MEKLILYCKTGFTNCHPPVPLQRGKIHGSFAVNKGDDLVSYRVMLNRIKLPSYHKIYFSRSTHKINNIK